MRQAGRSGAAAGAMCALLLVAGCTGKTIDGQPAAAFPAAATTSSGASATGAAAWYGNVDGVAVLVQWVRVGSTVTGTLTAAGVVQGNTRTASHPFTGVIGGATVILNFPDNDTSWSIRSLTGTLAGSELRLEYPTGGGTSPIVLHSGTVDDFNRIAPGATPSSAQAAGPQRFDAAKVALGVEKILTDPAPQGYGQTGVADVVCPPDEPVVTGTTFSCTVTVNGAQKSVLITVKDESGKYEVGVPS